MSKKAASRKKTPAKRGRPTSYRAEYAEQAEKLCRYGATDAELADFFGVTTRTIGRWQAGHEDFCRALKVGKEVADDRVERSLFHRAVGYSHPDTHISNHQGKITATPITKHYPPDTTAMIFWLKNRRKQDWRDRHEHTGPDGGPILVQRVRYSDAPAGQGGGES